MTTSWPPWTAPRLPARFCRRRPASRMSCKPTRSPSTSATIPALHRRLPRSWAPLILVRGEPADEIVRVGRASRRRAGRPRPDRSPWPACAGADGTSSGHPLVQAGPGRAAGHPPRPTLTRALFPLDGDRGVSAALRPLIATYVAAGLEVIALHVFRPDTVPRFMDRPEDIDVWHEEFLAEHCAELGLRLVTRPGPTPRRRCSPSQPPKTSTSSPWAGARTSHRNAPPWYARSSRPPAGRWPSSPSPCEA